MKALMRRGKAVSRVKKRRAEDDRAGSLGVQADKRVDRSWNRDYG
jgi:hypothetical protein